MAKKIATNTAKHRREPADPTRERSLLWRAQATCSAAQAAGIIGLAWYSLVLGAGPLGAGLVFAAALAPSSAAGFFPRAARVMLWRGRRPALWGGQLVMAAALASAFVTAGLGWPIVPVVAAFVLGLGRALFDTAASSILHAHVDHERQHRALRDLTERYSSGQPMGIVIALVGGFAAGQSPLGAIGAAAALACLGTVLSVRHHEDLDRVPRARVRFLAAMAESRRELAHHARLRAALIGGGVGVAIGTGQAALLISWLAVGPDVRGDRLVPTLLIAVLGAHFVMSQFGSFLRERAPGTQLALALVLQAAGVLIGWQAPNAATASAAYGLTLVAGAMLVELATRVREETVPAGLAPAIGATAGGAWGFAGALGALCAAGASLVLNLGTAFAVLGGVAIVGGVLAVAASSLRGRPGPRREPESDASVPRPASSAAEVVASADVPQPEPVGAGGPPPPR